VTRFIPLNEIQILPNGVGGTSIPVKPYPLLRGDDLKKMAELLVEDIPAVFQVIMEGLGLVLG
jgi:hypothetical protein